MKHFHLLFLAILLAISPLSSARENILMNRDYKFSLGDIAGAEAPEFDDSAWLPTALPHSFSTPYWGENRFHIGYGWYRKVLHVKPEWKGKRITLDFEGVFQECDLYINGKLVGTHQGGYTGFEFDISEFVQPGKNTMAVRVNNLWNPELAPRAGEHVFSGGIYRDVRLIVTDPVHVTWYGTFIKTPRVSAKSASVEMTVEVGNSGKSPVKGTVVTWLVDPKGKKTGQTETPFEVGEGKTSVVVQKFPEIANPQLWHPDSPRLYKACSRIMVEGEIRDSYVTSFGIRWFEFTKDRGFFLNGKPYYIIGANVHQDRAGWGDAVPNSAFFRDVKMIKDAGMNFIRGSHYPHDPAFSQACDELGILLWSEGVFWGIGGFTADGYWNSSAYPPDARHHAGFETSLRNTLRDMVRVHRNHPSIVTWSMGNEIFFTHKAVMDKAKACTTSLVEYCRELDPTRPAVVGGVQREDFDKIGDLAGYNGDGAYVKNPSLPNLVAEYGSVVSNRPGSFDPYLGCLKGQERFPWRSGQVLWCGFHHGSIAGSMGRMGFIDYARLPLRSWYWYRENLAGIKAPAWPEKGTPAGISLTTDRKILKADGTEDAQIIVALVDAKGKRVDAAVPVTLAIESGPGIFPTGKSITFKPGSAEAAIIEGWAAIDFRSYYAGKTRIKASSPGLRESFLELVCTGAPAFDKNSREWIPAAGPKSEPGSLTSPVECAKDRPATASSTNQNSQPLMGNDGDPGTSWTTTLDDAGKAWWRLDLENFYGIRKITLSGVVSSCFTVEITADEGKTWTIAGEGDKAARIDGRHVFICDPAKVYGRFLRIRYEGDKGEEITLGEISVLGIAR